MNYPKRRAGTPGAGGGGGVTAVSISPSASPAKDPYASELWEAGCHEGNAIGAQSIRNLGFQWYKGVTPPK